MKRITYAAVAAIALGGLAGMGCEREDTTTTTTTTTPGGSSTTGGTPTTGPVVDINTDKLRNAADRTGDAIQRGVDKTGDALSTAADKTRDVAKDVGGKVGDAASRAVDSTKDAAGRAVDSTKDTADRAADQTGDAVDTAKDRTGDAVDSTKDAADNAADRTGDAVDDAKDRTGDAVDDAKDPGPRAAAGALNPDDARNLVAQMTSAAVTKGGLDDLAERFTQADYDRLKRGVNQNFADLDGRIEQLSKDWQAKYNQEFKENADPAAFPPTTFTAGRGGLQVAQSRGMPALTVPMVHESPDRWKIDAPDTLTADKLKANVLAHLTAFNEMRDQWPPDANQAYAMLSHHVLMAVLDKPAR